MSWTTPRTYVTSELITAAILNTDVRDNMTQLKAADDLYLPLAGGTITGGLTVGTATGAGTGCVKGSGSIAAGADGIYGLSTFNGVTIGHAGKPGLVIALAANQTFTFSLGPAKLFAISTIGGQACLVFGSYSSATLTFLANPDGTNIFDLTSTPGANIIGIYKSDSSNAISVKHGSGDAIQLYVSVLGDSVTACTAPV